MKQRGYETPEILITEFCEEDVITTSGIGEDEKVFQDIFDGIDVWE